MKAHEFQITHEAALYFIEEENLAERGGVFPTA